MLLIAIVTMFTVSMFSTVSAAERSGRFKQRAGIRHRVISALMELDLTQKQKKDIRAIVTGAIKENKELIRSFADAKKNAAEMIRADEFNEQAIRDAVQKLEPIEEDLAVVRAKTFSKIKALLTPGQKEILKKLKFDLQNMFRGGKFLQEQSE